MPHDRSAPRIQKTKARMAMMPDSGMTGATPALITARANPISSPKARIESSEGNQAAEGTAILIATSSAPVVLIANTVRPLSR